MDINLPNAASTHVLLGTRDRSIPVVPLAAEQRPQHLPLFYIFAERGKGKHLVSGASRERIFGSDTFNPRSKYFNHQTLFMNKAIAAGNSCMVQRIVPSDAGPRANTVLWLDVLPTTEVDLYERSPTDGSIVLDANGEPTNLGTTTGYKIKWVRTHRTTVADQADSAFGTYTSVQGNQTFDPGGGAAIVRSTRYPIFETEIAWEGEQGKNYAVRMWAQTTQGGATLPTRVMEESSAYPYFFTLLERSSPTSSFKPTPTVFGEYQLPFTLQRGVVDPTTNRRISYNDLLPSSYNQDTRGLPFIQGPIGKFFVYDANVAALQALFYASELEEVTDFSDITEDPKTAGLINLLTATNSNGSPYETILFVDETDSVRLSQYTHVVMDGSSDGTLDNTEFEAGVSTELDRYLDPDDDVQDIAYHTESAFWDSGFSLDLKMKIPQFISVRKDTYVFLGTHTVGGDTLSAADEYSIATNLRTRMQNYPESELFGTPVMRGLIDGMSGIPTDTEYAGRVSSLYSRLGKIARYMGAGDGRWKQNFYPAGEPNNVITDMRDFNIVWTPYSTRVRYWDAGLNWVTRSSRTGFVFISFKTVYDNDASVLNNIITVAAIAELNKIANQISFSFLGRNDLTDTQLIASVNEAVRKGVFDRFAGQFTIIPDTRLTERDRASGFSFSLIIQIGARNSRSVMITQIDALREADLTAQ